MEDEAGQWYRRLKSGSDISLVNKLQMSSGGRDPFMQTFNLLFFFFKVLQLQERLQNDLNYKLPIVCVCYENTLLDNDKCNLEPCLLFLWLVSHSSMALRRNCVHPFQLCGWSLSSAL